MTDDAKDFFEFLDTVDAKGLSLPNHPKAAADPLLAAESHALGMTVMAFWHWVNVRKLRRDRDEGERQQPGVN